MSIKDRLLKSGAIINTRETNFGEYRKEVEIWYRNDSPALRESVDILLELYPELTLHCYGRPVMNRDTLPHMPALWRSRLDPHGPDIHVRLDIEDCSHCNLYEYVSLEILLAKVREYGPKSMLFHITVDCDVWQQIVAKGE